MNNIFTTKQNLEKLFEKTRGTTFVLFPCPICGHRNKPKGSNLDRVKLYLEDKLPQCRGCGRKLGKELFDRSTIPGELRMRGLKELGFKEIIRCPQCSQKLRVPTKKQIKVTCPKCMRRFNFIP